jgi:chromosome segregation ATPase
LETIPVDTLLEILDSELDGNAREMGALKAAIEEQTAEILQLEDHIRTLEELLYQATEQLEEYRLICDVFLEE